MTSTGKIQKYKLRDEAMALAARLGQTGANPFTAGSVGMNEEEGDEDSTQLLRSRL
jgi:hypothetical protein